MIENQHEIAAWADQTFGPPTSNARIAARANEEMAELLRVLTSDDWSRKKAVEEIADIIIVLCRLMTRLGGDFNQEIARKMEINRARVWSVDKEGHGYHVRDKSALSSAKSE